MSAGDINRIPPLPASPQVQGINSKDDAAEERESQQEYQKEEEEEKEDEEAQQAIQDSYEGADPDTAEVTAVESEALKAAAQSSKEKEEEEQRQGGGLLDLQA